LNVTEIIQFLGMLNVHTYRIAGDQVRSTCPFSHWNHQGGRDTHPSFSVKSGVRAVGYCFGCGTAGNLLGIAFKYGKLTGNYSPVDFVKSCENIDDLSFDYLEPFEVVRPVSWGFKKKSNVADKIQYIPNSTIERFMDSIPKYIIDRGITVETAEKFCLGYDRDNKDVIIPVYDITKKLVGYSRRNIHASGYYHSKGFTRSFVVYGEHLHGGGRCEDMIIVEGFFDVMKLVQNGYNAVGIMGTNMTNYQKNKILKLSKNIIIMMDGDKAGLEAAEKIYDEFKNDITTKIARIPQGKDPDDLTKEEVEKMIYAKTTRTNTNTNLLPKVV
jgi:DNA primase